MVAPAILSVPSPNHDSRDKHPIDMLILHYTGMKSGQAALERLCDIRSKVSSHYLVEEDGAIYKLVDESQRAWHAGVSCWRGNTNINQRSIGIEIVNPGHEFGYRDFTPPQMLAVKSLCKDILSRHKIAPRNIIGHSDVAPARKEDPGELFDWAWLASRGIGLWTSPKDEVAQEAGAEQLAEYGYDITDMQKAITAFQRHFRPALLNGKWDITCSRRLASLLSLVQTT